MSKERYNGEYDALPPEDAAKFFHGSRKPFDYEQPVLDVAKAAMKEVGGFKKFNKED
jgi:hypothetical protein